MTTTKQNNPQNQHEKTHTYTPENNNTKVFDMLQFFGLHANSTSKDFKKAYRDKIKTLHPDKQGNANLAAQCNEHKEVGEKYFCNGGLL